MSGSRVIVVGAGVVGLACAHYLRRAGVEVTLIDQDRVGAGCSHANCGYICPSHALPLAGPGVIGKTMWTLLQKDSALKIRLRFDPSLWAWLIRFALRCNRGAMLDAARGISALLNSSRRLYEELFHPGGLDRAAVEWEEKGLLFLYRTPAEMEHYAATDRLLREEFDQPARRLDGRELLELDPALKPDLAGGWHYPGDAHLRPDRLVAAWHQHLLQQGVAIRENCPLVGLERQGQRVVAVQTATGSLAADHVVVATGAWTPLLRRQLGINPPIQPGKGYSITMARPGRCPRVPMIFEEDRVAITPFATGYRIGSTMEFAGHDRTLDPRRLELLTRAAARYLHEPLGDPVVERWWGWRPMVPDGKPIVGQVPRQDNLWLATGHGMLGLSMATGTGKLVSELITGQVPHVDPVPYSAGRF